MRKFGKESAAPAKGDEGRQKDGSGWFRNHWCLVSMCVIVAVAFLLRTVFVYGLSAGGDFALSGGSSAQNHLHVVESILNGTFAIGTDAAVNYPLGGLNVVPPLMDFLAAAVACLLGMFGMSTVESASAALAVLPPIFGALTCIPVYWVAKEFFDEKVGVVAALIFAFLALPISSSVFSNGTEYAFAGFLIACMSYFLVRTVKLMESDAPSKTVYVSSLISGVLMGLVALTWNGFGLLVVLVAAPMLLQAVFDRIRGKDFTAVLIGHSLTILVGVAIAAAYYIPAGLWDAVFSGPLLLAVLAVIFGFLFKALSGKPWIAVIPALFVVLAVILVALYVAAPELFAALVYGNPIYSGTLADLVSNHVSMSNVSSYYGWLTMWLPLCLALYEMYVYIRKDRSMLRLFLITWLLVLYFAVWSGYSSAAVIGVVFAVGSAAVIVKILQRADLKEWVKSVRTAGFPAGFRKLIKPFPFASVLITALLVIAPNFTYAVDAGMSNNIDGDHFFSGNTQFVVKTGDSYPIGNVWDEYADVDKDGAAVIWIDYVADAIAQGNFDTVASSYGEGVEVTANMLLADGSSGMTAAMMIRIMMSVGIDSFAGMANMPQAVYDEVKSYIDDPSKAKLAITSAPETFGDVRSDMTDENAIYLAGAEAIASAMDQTSVLKAYEEVCTISGDSIDYIILDPSMLPISYGGGDSFSSLAYFAGYDTDEYGAAGQFYSYNTTYGYTTYTDAMYDTFLWKAFIGPSAKDAGFSSSYSYLYSLSLSDGTTVAMPGYGLAGYKVDYWQVMYNPDNKATASSDGWEYMPIADAVAKQKADGGLINYLSSIVVLKYYGVDNVVSGSYDSRYAGATLEGYCYDDLSGRYKLIFSDVVDENGAYTLSYGNADWKYVVRNGSLVLATEIGQLPDKAILDAIENVSASATVLVGDDILANSNMSVVLSNVDTGDDVATFPVANDGTVTIDSILPGQYTVRLNDATGANVSSSTVVLVPGVNEGLKIMPKTYNITVTVKELSGKLVDEGQVEVFATDSKTGVVYGAVTGDDGKAVIAVLPGTYVISADATTVTNPSVTVTKSNTTSSISVALGAHQSGSGYVADFPLFVYGGPYSFAVDASGNVEVPKVPASEKMHYTVYGTDGVNVVLGLFGDSISTKVAYKISGTTTAGAVVEFINVDGAIVKAVADSDGKYSVYLPEGDYFVHADNGKDKAFLGTTSVVDADKTLDIALVDGRVVSASVKVQSGTSSGYINQPFVYAQAKVVDSSTGTTYMLYSVTDSNGKVSFVVPDNLAVDVAIGDEDGEFENAAFHIGSFTSTFDASASDKSKTFYIYNKELDSVDADDNYMMAGTIVPEYDAELTYYSDNKRKYTLVEGQPIEILPGQYTAEVKTDDMYFDGTVYFYGMSTLYGLNPVDVVKVEFTIGDKDSITVTSDGGNYWKDGTTYWFQKYDDENNTIVYTIKSVNTSGDEKKIAYATIDTGAPVAAVDVTANQTQMTVTGNIGIVVDGTITVKNGTVALDFDVKDGQYTMTLPSTWTTVLVDVEAEAVVLEYDSTYAVTGFELSGLVDGAVRNVPVTTTGFVPTGDSDLVLTIENMTNYADRAELTVKLTGGEAGMTYVLTPGNAWAFDKVVSVVNGGTVSFVAYYNGNNVSMLEDGLTITATSINGDDSVTIHATLTEADADASVTVDTTVKDVVAASQYRFAISVDNGNNLLPVDAVITVDGLVDNILTDANGNKWYVTFADALYVKNVGEFRIAANTSDYMLYICLMSLDGTGTVSSISIDYVIGSTVGSAELRAQSLDLSVEDMSVSGGAALNKRSDIPVGVWFMLAVGIILAVGTLYLASKRGVFSRRS